MGVKWLKFKNLKFRLLEALDNFLLDMCNIIDLWQKTEQVDRFFHHILPNFDNFGPKRIKIVKFKIPACRGPAECIDTHSCQISLSYDENWRRRFFLKLDGRTDNRRTDGSDPIWLLKLRWLRHSEAKKLNCSLVNDNLMSNLFQLLSCHRVDTFFSYLC